MSCVNMSNIGLPVNWARSAHLGLTATTGQLADNHDIISLKSYTDAQLLDVAESDEIDKRHFQLDIQQSLDQQLKRCFIFVSKFTVLS